MPVEASLDAYTGTGSLVLFEPAPTALEAGEEFDWFADNDVLVSLANDGLLVPIRIRVDGVWLVRITTEDLTDLERRAVLQTERNFWIHIQSHEVVFGGLEALPVREGPAERFVDEFGDRIECDPGRFQVTVHRLIGQHAEDVEGLMASSSSRVPCWVLVLRRLEDHEPPPHLDALPDLSFLQPNSG
jgi:hypothetical protein